jgi:hypothetical protein
MHRQVQNRADACRSQAGQADQNQTKELFGKDDHWDSGDNEKRLLLSLYSDDLVNFILAFPQKLRV